MAIEDRPAPGAATGTSEDDDVAMTRRALVLNVAFWTLFAVYQASIRLLPIGDGFPDPGRMIALSLITAYLWALLTPPIFRLAAWVIAAHDAGTARLALVLVVVGAIGFAVAVLAAIATGATHRVFLPRPGPPGMRGWMPPVSIRDLEWNVSWAWAQRRWFSQQAVTFVVVLVAGVVSHMSRRYRARERMAAQLQAQSAELQAQLAEARLAVLRTRLNPHFLFNTLNAVSALVATDPRGVRNMIALLSELLRYALSDSNEQEIPLRDELALLRIYLEILEIRYQGQLRTVVSAEGAAQDALVPNLILQPLVENAVKHAIDRAGGHGTIEVRAHRAGDDLVLTVRDTGPGDGGAASSEAPDGAGAPSAGSGQGIGLRLTRDRLSELYGDEHRLELEPVPDGGPKAGMIARVTLPYHTSDDVRVAEELAER